MFSLIFAPGEGKRPIFHEPLAEHIVSLPYFVDRNTPQIVREFILYNNGTYSNMNCILLDTRVASNIPNIFWKTNHKQMKQIADKVSLAVHRNKTKSKKITAQMLVDKEGKE